jgi:hypothetical protein
MFEHRNLKGLRVRKVIGFAVLGSLIAGALGLLVMGLWNALLPPLFGLKTLHFWQALGLLLLSRILFGGIHHRRGPGFHHRQRMIQRWERMTPEERERFRQGFRSRFCHARESSEA